METKLIAVFITCRRSLLVKGKLWISYVYVGFFFFFFGEVLICELLIYDVEFCVYCAMHKDLLCKSFGILAVVEYVLLEFRLGRMFWFNKKDFGLIMRYGICPCEGFIGALWVITSNWNCCYLPSKLFSSNSCCMLYVGFCSWFFVQDGKKLGFWRY